MLESAKSKETSAARKRKRLEQGGGGGGDFEEEGGKKKNEEEMENVLLLSGGRAYIPDELYPLFDRDYAYDINEAGQIVGQGYDPDGYDHAFLLTPIPEPSMVSLLGLAFVLGMGFVNRPFWKKSKRV